MEINLLGSVSQRSLVRANDSSSTSDRCDLYMKLGSSCGTGLSWRFPAQTESFLWESGELWMRWTAANEDFSNARLLQRQQGTFQKLLTHQSHSLYFFTVKCSYIRQHGVFKAGPDLCTLICLHSDSSSISAPQGVVSAVCTQALLLNTSETRLWCVLYCI